MSEKTLSADTWRAKRKQSKVVALASLGDAKVILRPMSALRKLALEKISEDSGFLASLVADTVVSGEVDGDTIVSQGDPIWTSSEIVSEEFPADALVEITSIVLDYLELRADPKNSPAASDSPSASP